MLEKAPLMRRSVFTIPLKPSPVATQISMNHDHDQEIESEIKSCLYKSSEGWKQRIQLNELEVGQKIIGEKIAGTDLLGGKTGPKLFFECGVGRVDARGKWHMVSAMLRFQTKYTKISVIRKRTAKFSENQVELYVHRIRLDNGQLEVCADHETLLSAIANDKKNSIVPSSSLKVGQELVGTVIELRPYGCLVDVGANRRGLLHIQKVADLYGKYIKKESGLKMAGLEQGAIIRVAVLENKKKRLALDFAKDVKEDAKKMPETKSTSEVVTMVDNDKLEETSVVETSEDDAIAWGAYSADDYYEDDEDRGIEDALGLGSY